MGLAIIIPCYNEVKRLSAHEIDVLAKDINVSVYLVNDGSTDNTLNLIKEISSKYNNVFFINYEVNTGKAGVIYKAYNEIKHLDYNNIGILDADFSTSAQDYLKMYYYLKPNFNFIFASRIATLNNQIDREMKRHYIGRTLITLLNFKYHLGIYDTQCGAKIFNKDVLQYVFENPFKTKWLFDIEIFIRLKKHNLLSTGFEYSLPKWRDVAGSKLSGTESIRVFKDLFLLLKNY